MKKVLFLILSVVSVVMSLDTLIYKNSEINKTPNIYYFDYIHYPTTLTNYLGNIINISNKMYFTSYDSTTSFVYISNDTLYGTYMKSYNVKNIGRTFNTDSNSFYYITKNYNVYHFDITNGKKTTTNVNSSNLWYFAYDIWSNKISTNYPFFWMIDSTSKRLYSSEETSYPIKVYYIDSNDSILTIWKTYGNERIITKTNIKISSKDTYFYSDKNKNIYLVEETRNYFDHESNYKIYKINNEVITTYIFNTFNTTNIYTYSYFKPMFSENNADTFILKTSSDTTFKVTLPSSPTFISTTSNDTINYTIDSTLTINYSTTAFPYNYSSDEPLTKSFNKPSFVTITDTFINPSWIPYTSSEEVNVYNAFKISIDSSNIPYGSYKITSILSNSISTDSSSFYITINPPKIDTTPIITIDTIKPTVILSNYPSTISEKNIPFKVTATFSEKIFGLALNDITISNGTASNLSGNDSIYTFNVLLGYNENFTTIFINEKTVKDSTGNDNTKSNTITITYSRNDTFTLLTVDSIKNITKEYIVPATVTTPYYRTKTTFVDSINVSYFSTNLNSSLDYDSIVTKFKQISGPTFISLIFKYMPVNPTLNKLFIERSFTIAYTNIYDSTYTFKYERIINNIKDTVSFTFTAILKRTSTSTESAISYTNEIGTISPNPCNPSTTINFSISQTTPVSIKMYDVKGNMIKVINESLMNAGNYKMNVNMNDIASGYYFVKMNIGSMKKNTMIIVTK